MCDPRDSQGDEKMQFLFLLLLPWLFDQKWKNNFREMQNKNPFEIILHVGRVTSLQSSVAKKSCHGQTLVNQCSILTTFPILKACNSPYMQCYFKLFLVLHSSEVIFSFLIKTSRQKAIEMEIAFFHPLGNPKGRTLDHFLYASHIRHNFPYKLIPISVS